MNTISQMDNADFFTTQKLNSHPLPTDARKLVLCMCFWGQAFNFAHPKSSRTKKDCPLALASVYYDVLNHISIDSSINHTTASERECAAAHLHYAQPDDLSILDRGYNGFWLYAFYKANKQGFCHACQNQSG